MPLDRDFYWFAEAYGTSVGDRTYELAADLDRDTDVDEDDSYPFAGNYGEGV